jgi:hypothetical protein
MSIFTHLPNQFEFEHQGGVFTAKKSFWQNTLDKSADTYIISLEGIGEYVETDIGVNTDDWVADAIAAVDAHTNDLNTAKFIETGDEEVTDDLIEAATAPPEESSFDEEVAIESVQDYDVDLPFPAVTEDTEEPLEGETDESMSEGDAQAVEDVAISRVQGFGNTLEEEMANDEVFVIHGDAYQPRQ